MQIDWIFIRYVHTVCHHMFEFITEYYPAQDSQNSQYEILSTLGVRGKPDISLIEFTNDYSHASCPCHYYFIFNILFIYLFLLLFYLLQATKVRGQYSQHYRIKDGR